MKVKSTEEEHCGYALKPLSKLTMQNNGCF